MPGTNGDGGVVRSNAGVSHSALSTQHSALGRGPVGIIANPLSGKDIRRLVAHASVFDNQEKRNILRRAVLGAVAAGARDFLYMADSHGLAAGALDGLELPVRWEGVP